MELELSEQSQELLNLLMTIPPKLNSAREYLDVNHLSPDEVTRIANVYADTCIREDNEYPEEDWPLLKEVIQTNFSAYLYDVVDLLLQYGLDPNVIYTVDGDIYNIMHSIAFIDNGYTAADTMVLLMEAGGDPNLVVEFETIYEFVSDDVWFGAIEQELRWRYDSWIHVWMVLLAYGGKSRGRKSPLEVYREYDSTRLFNVQKLRNHRDYYYGLSKENYEPVIRIYDKRTMWEVTQLWEDPNTWESASASSLEKELELLLFDM